MIFSPEPLVKIHPKFTRSIESKLVQMKVSTCIPEEKVIAK